MANLTDIRRALQAGPELRLPRRRQSSTEGAAPSPKAAINAPTGSRLSRLRGPEISLPRLSRTRGPQVSLPRLSRRGTAAGLVGLEIEADSIAAVEIRGDGEPAKTAVAPLPPGAFADGEVLDPAAVSAALRAMWSEHGLSKRVRLGVANQRVVTRTLQLPAIEDPGQLAKAVRFQAEDQIPMPLDQAILDHRVVGSSSGEEEASGTIEVVVSAARREMVGAALKPLRDAGLDPVGVDLSAFALIRALDGAPRVSAAADGEVTPGTTLFCNVGETSNLAIARQRVCRFTRVTQAGLASIVSSLCERTGMSPDHARMWIAHVGLGQSIGAVEGDPAVAEATRAALEGGASALLDDLRMTIDFYGAQESGPPVDRVVLGGPGGAVPGLADRLGIGLELPVSADVPSALGTLDRATAARLTLPYGLALEE